VEKKIRVYRSRLTRQNLGVCESFRPSFSAQLHTRFVLHHFPRVAPATSTASTDAPLISSCPWSHSWSLLCLGLPSLGSFVVSLWGKDFRISTEFFSFASAKEAQQQAGHAVYNWKMTGRTLLSASLLNLLCGAHPDQSVMWLELLHRLVRVIDEGEACALASTVVCSESEDTDLVFVCFVQLG
jgi:hypothetical protein